MKDDVIKQLDTWRDKWLKAKAEKDYEKEDIAYAAIDAHLDNLSTILKQEASA